VNGTPIRGGGKNAWIGWRNQSLVANEKEKKLAEQSRKKVVEQFPNKKVVTPILDASTFYPIKGEESYHQDYYKKSPIRYNYYRWGCGRDKRLKDIWGDKATH
jgi:peptide-methionine (S)-S-oxide reductase